MKKKYLYTTAVISVLIIVFYTIVYANSAGATYGICGAPDDQVPGSCGTTAGNCHNIMPITDSTKALKITMIDPTTNQPVTSYQLGKKYTVKIELTYRTLIACGFESTIETAATDAHVGTLTAGTRSQIIRNPTNTSATYATHYSSARTSLHYGMWEYNWTAPTKTQGDLIIYAAGNSANGNGNNSGDTIFNTQMTISHNSGIENQVLNNSQISVYPIPASDNININYTLLKAENTSIEVLDPKGQQIKIVQSGIMPMGENKVNTDIKGLRSGIYFMRITAGGETSVKKFIIGQ